jgi:hypothetical protein
LQLLHNEYISYGTIYSKHQISNGDGIQKQKST